MRAILESLPMAPWMTEEIMPLVPHPSDPAAYGSRLGAGRPSGRGYHRRPARHRSGDW
jgi:Muconolactone delta-isomerase